MLLAPNVALGLWEVDGRNASPRSQRASGDQSSSDTSGSSSADRPRSCRAVAHCVGFMLADISPDLRSRNCPEVLVPIGQDGRSPGVRTLPSSHRHLALGQFGAPEGRSARLCSHGVRSTALAHYTRRARLAAGRAPSAFGSCPCHLLALQRDIWGALGGLDRERIQSRAAGCPPVLCSAAGATSGAKTAGRMRRLPRS